MPDYKRIISYIYNYEEGKKKSNVGYARVEARNGQCKCTLHITAPSLNDRQLQVYIFKRKGGAEGILLGTMVVKGGNGDFRTITDSMHLMNSPYGLEDMNGILLFLTDRKFFATSWDEAPITMELVSGIAGNKSEPILQAAGVVTDNTNTESTKTIEKAETVEDNIIKVNFNENEKKAAKVLEEKQEPKNEEEPDNIMESEEYRDQNEGEVFNDWHDGGDALKLSSQDTKNVSSVKIENQVDNRVENKTSKDSESRTNSKSYIEIPEELRQELSDRVELLQKEDLSKDLDNADQKEETENVEIKTEEKAVDSAIEDQKEDADSLVESEEADKVSESEVKQDSQSDTSVNEPDSGFVNTELHFNNSELRPESIGSTVEANTKDIPGSPTKQPIFEDHPIAKKLYLSYPRMYPFEDNDVAWCVRIEPQDIGLFPMESWILANNSFLLHGYYSYRHLIFARINDKNGVSYILGVPGIYHNREKFMAKMFGFENFKCAKRKVQRTGEFGYWYIPITLS